MADECVVMVGGAYHLTVLLVSMEIPPGMVVEGGWNPMAGPTWRH